MRVSRKTLTKKMRLSGRPMRVHDHEYEEARRRILHFHKQGATFKDIGTAANIPGADKIADKRTKWMHRNTYNRIMAVTEVPIKSTLGATLSTVKTVRMLRALCWEGYTPRYLAQRLNAGEPHIRRLIRGETSATKARTEHKVAVLFNELLASNPATHGIPARSSTRIRKLARERVYEPWWCWDVEALGDPDAVPEWTGHCGSYRGYRLHLSNDLPVCARCRLATRERRSEWQR